MYSGSERQVVGIRTTVSTMMQRVKHQVSVQRRHFVPAVKSLMYVTFAHSFSYIAWLSLFWQLSPAMYSWGQLPVPWGNSLPVSVWLCLHNWLLQSWSDCPSLGLAWAVLAHLQLNFWAQLSAKSLWRPIAFSEIVKWESVVRNEMLINEPLASVEFAASVYAYVCEQRKA